MGGLTSKLKHGTAPAAFWQRFKATGELRVIWVCDVMMMK